MQSKADKEIVYSINVADIQNVANQVLERCLTKKELLLVGKSVGDYVDWFQSIESAIRKHLHD
jgi:hypothetical protein